MIRFILGLLLGVCVAAAYAQTDLPVATSPYLMVPPAGLTLKVDEQGRVVCAPEKP